MPDLEDWGNPELFQAMSHPLRVQILGDLSLPGARLAPSDFSEKVNRPLSNVSYHFRELEKFGIIEVVEEQKVRGSVKHTYRAVKRALFTNSSAWEKMPGKVRTSVAARTWHTYLEVIGRAIEGGAFEKRPNTHFSWGTMRVDQRGYDDMQAEIDSSLARMFEIEDESDKRRKASGEEGIDATYSFGGFESPPPAPPKNDDEEGGQ